MKCSKCKTDSTTVIPFINQITKEVQYICDNCLISSLPKIKEIDTLDKEITEIESKLKTLVEIIESGKEPDISDMDETLSSFCFTPSKLFNIFTKLYNKLITNKQQILGAMNKLDKLLYELKGAIEYENYEKAAELRDRIAKLSGSDIRT